MSEIVALFWDIDGTLLTTERAGVYALEAAATHVLGKPIDLQTIRTAGLTDVSIAREVLQAGGMDPTPEQIHALLRYYEDALPACLPRKQGWVMPNVVSILERIQKDKAYFSILLTGNTRRGAQAKLNHYGLSDFFDLELGAFSDEADTREDIARDAWQRFQKAHPGSRAEQAFVIGDTPHDVRCAQAIDAKVIGVGTGGYEAQKLADLGSWWAVPELPAADVFFDKIHRAMPA